MLARRPLTLSFSRASLTGRCVRGGGVRVVGGVDVGEGVLVSAIAAVEGGGRN